MSGKRKTVGFRIDIETRSGVDVKRGSYVYAEDAKFAVLIISYCPIYEYEDGTTKLGKIRTLDESDPAEVGSFKRALTDPGFQKHAFNANFERVCLSKWLGMENGVYVDPENWRCSAIRANVNGVFGTLDEVARAVRSPIKKDPEGKRLIRMFSMPDGNKRSSRYGEHHTPANCPCGADHWQDFLMFRAYCENDVLTEAVIARAFPDPPAHVQQEYEADQRINDRGIRHFKGLAQQAMIQVEAEKDRVMNVLARLTGLDNPNSVQQFSAWMEFNGYPMLSLDKEHREEALGDPLLPENVRTALVLKGQASMTSVTKHKAALNTRCGDGRIRGSLQFYGAHTGREAGRGLQPQNLPRYEASPSDRSRLILGLAGQDAPLIAKGTVRSSLVPAKGHLFVVADYNAIEARVLGFLSGERWVQEEFITGQGAIYEATAATMFGVDKNHLIASLKACGKCGTCENCSLRSRGKVSNLALGYAGGAGALVTMGAEEAGIDCGNYKELSREWAQGGRPGKFHEWERDRHDYPELLRLRDLFRDASPMTVRFWKLCARAWDVAALTGQPVAFGNNQILSMVRDGKHNRMVLPSGRSIWYRFAAAHKDDNDAEKIDRRTFIGKAAGIGHTRIDTHGGKLTENVTQAVARDVLFDLMLKLEAKTASGWPARIVLHVHDEVVLEVPAGAADQVLADTLGLMSVPPAWAPGLSVRGAGSIMTRYGK